MRACFAGYRGRSFFGRKWVLESIGTGSIRESTDPIMQIYRKVWLEQSRWNVVQRSIDACYALHAVRRIEGYKSVFN